MTGAEALNLIMARLGNRTQPSIRANALLEMKLAQQTKLEGGPVKPWFLITELATAVLTPNDRRLEVPDNFLSELEDEGELVVIDQQGIEHNLEKKGWDELVAWHGAEATATVPENYCLVGQYFMLFPTPTLGLNVRMRYKASQTLPADDNTETSWLKYAADWLIGEAGIVMCKLHVRDTEPSVLQGFQELRDTGYARVIADDAARAEANRNRRMG